MSGGQATKRSEPALPAGERGRPLYNNLKL